ncbi:MULTISPECIES: hypothetical protein [unclassified Nonomuraea]
MSPALVQETCGNSAFPQVGEEPPRRNGSDFWIFIFWKIENGKVLL